MKVKIVKREKLLLIKKMKKKLNFFLIGLLIIIWGSVIYKYFGKKESNKNLNFAELPLAKQNIRIDKIKDTFKLEFSGRDPFLNTKPVRERVFKAKQSKVVSKKSSKRVIASVMWPKIEYYGFVKSNSSKSELVVIKINSRLHKVRKNQEIDELRITQTWSDSIEIEFQKKKRFFYRKTI